MKFLCSIGLLLVVGLLHADCDCDGYSTLQIGGNYTYANIKVDDQSTFHGNLGGVQGSYEYRSDSNLYAGIKAAWKQGETKNSFAKRNLVYVDVQERLGYTFYTPCYEGSLTLFSGFAYRYLGHKLKQFETELSSIKFHYNEFYVPVGFLSDYFFTNCFSVGLNFTWMPQVFPTVEIIPLKGTNWSLRESLKNVSVELPLRYFFTEDRCYFVEIKPFYEFWEDGQSTAETSSGEPLGLPKNKYNFYGVELNIAFLF